MIRWRKDYQDISQEARADYLIEEIKSILENNKQRLNDIANK